MVLAFATFVANKLVLVLRDRLKVQLTDQQVKTLHDAADTAAGVGMTMLSRGVITLSELHVNDPTIVGLASVAVNAVSAAADAKGVKVPDMATIVVGRIGKLISADRTIPTLPAVVATPTPANQDTSNAKAA